MAVAVVVAEAGEAAMDLNVADQVLMFPDPTKKVQTNEVRDRSGLNLIKL